MLEVIPSVVQIEDIPLEEASTEAPKKPNLTLQITSSNKDLLDTSEKSPHIIKKEPHEKNIFQIDLMSPTKNNSKEDEIDKLLIFTKAVPWPKWNHIVKERRFVLRFLQLILALGNLTFTQADF